MSTDSGKKIAVNYDTCFDFELGTCYVTKSKIVYILEKDKEKYYHNAIKRITGLKYKDKRMENELSRFLPEIYQTFRTKNGKYAIVLDKTEDVYPLKNVFEYFGKQIDGKHVAWMISRLCSLTCYLEYSGLVHNGIHMDNCFVSPEDHSVLLTGGWWYATEAGEKMIGTAKDIFAIMSVSAKESKRSSAVTDLESVKLLGRQPKPFIGFLTGGSGRSAYDEFVKWDRALDSSYGKRKFIHMEIQNIY